MTVFSVEAIQKHDFQAGRQTEHVETRREDKECFKAAGRGRPGVGDDVTAGRGGEYREHRHPAIPGLPRRRGLLGSGSQHLQSGPHSRGIHIGVY